MIIIVTHTTYHEVSSIAIDFFKYDEGFRIIKQGADNKWDRCFQCDRAFKDGEYISLAAIKGEYNQPLCRACAETHTDVAIHRSRQKTDYPIKAPQEPPVCKECVPGYPLHGARPGEWLHCHSMSDIKRWRSGGEENPSV